MEKRIASLLELEHEAVSFVEKLEVLPGKATLVTLSGELGAGKTAFTKAIGKKFGIIEPVTSPTFVLEKIYLLPENKTGFSKLVHIDAYRLSGAGELRALGFHESMNEPEALVLLEWPEQVQGGLPKPAHQLTFSVNEDGSRTLLYG